jgi:hypothetical protein
LSAGNNRARGILHFTGDRAGNRLAKGHGDARQKGERTSQHKPQKLRIHQGLTLFIAADPSFFILTANGGRPVKRRLPLENTAGLSGSRTMPFFARRNAAKVAQTKSA